MPVSPAWEQHVRRGSLRCVLFTSSLISSFQIVFSVDSAEGDPVPMVGLASQVSSQFEGAAPRVGLLGGISVLPGGAASRMGS